MNEQMNLETVTRELKSLIKRASRERSGAFDGSYKLTIKVDHGGSIRYARVSDGRPVEGSDLLTGIQWPQRDPRPAYLEKAHKECDDARAFFDRVDKIYQETIDERTKEQDKLRNRASSFAEQKKLLRHEPEIAAATQERESAWERVVKANTALHQAGTRCQAEKEIAYWDEVKRLEELKKAKELKQRRLTLGPALARLRNRLTGNATA